MNGCKDKKSIEDIGLLPGDCVVRKELLILGENSPGYCTNSFMRCIPVGRQTSLRNRTAAGFVGYCRNWLRHLGTGSRCC